MHHKKVFLSHGYGEQNRNLAVVVAVNYIKVHTVCAPVKKERNFT